MTKKPGKFSGDLKKGTKSSSSPKKWIIERWYEGGCCLKALRGILIKGKKTCEERARFEATRIAMDAATQRKKGGSHKKE